MLNFGAYKMLSGKEKPAMTFKSRVFEDGLPFFSALGFGFAAHMFMLTNKIPVDDDICCIFDKGATTVSGRYGL